MPDAGGADDPFVKVEFSPDPGFSLLFRGLNATEELGVPFVFHVELSSKDLKDTKTMVGASVTVTMKQSAEGHDPTYLNGIVTRVVSSGMVSGAYRYRIEARPWIWLLTRVADCLIFQTKSAFDIITKVFRDAGFSDFEDKRQNSAGDVVLEYCVQYRETSFDFVMRLMEQFGIYYFFKHEDGKHTLVLADDPNAHETLSDSIPFGADKGGPETVADHIMHWEAARSLESAKFTFRDYNFTTPTADLTAKSIQSPGHQYGSFEVYDYPGPYEKAADGTKLTDVRIQAIGMNRNVIECGTNSRLLHPGWRFTLTDHPDQPSNRVYLVTRTEFSLDMGEMSAGQSGSDGVGTSDTYKSKLHVIPDDVNFRLERKTPRPMIRGPQTAVVDGDSGEEITTDEYGRVKVKFYWDRGDAQEGQHTCFIRVAQSLAGASWGSIYIPRQGQEVVVEFLEGNPDRPLITGVVYNANMKVPWTLPDNKTQFGIKTNSSKGGSGFNMLQFEDKAGSEVVTFQAQKDYIKKVLNNETVTIHKDTVTTVETGNHKTTVSQGDHKLEMSAGKSEVSAATSIEVKVGGNSMKIDTTSLTLTVGGNTIKMDPSGITINGTMISVQSSATMSLQGGAPVSISGPMVSIN